MTGGIRQIGAESWNRYTSQVEHLALRQITPVERLAEQTREWFDAAQRESDERTRIVTGIKFMWSLQREAWLRGTAQLIREPNRWVSSYRR